jgi:hypothetical protein
MKVNTINAFKAILVLGLCAGFFTNNAMASDDVGALVVDNGTRSIPEPGTWSLLLAGFVGAGLIARRKRKDK